MNANATQSFEADGKVLRRMTSEDEFLFRNLKIYSVDAHRDCSRWIEDQGLKDVLLDVEPLMDGKTLYFHFLGEVTPDLSVELDRRDYSTASGSRAQFSTTIEARSSPGNERDRRSRFG